MAAGGASGKIVEKNPAPEEQLNLYSKQKERPEMDQRDKLRRLTRNL